MGERGCGGRGVERDVRDEMYLLYVRVIVVMGGLWSETGVWGGGVQCAEGWRWRCGVCG